MKLKHLMLYTSYAVLTTVLGTSCASLTGYQDGRALGKGSAEVTTSFNVTGSQDYYVAADPSPKDIDKTIPVTNLPNIEFMAKYGFTDKLDMSMRVNAGGLLALGAKYQVIGDEESFFTLGTGLEIGTFSIDQSLYNFQIPLFGSIHPLEKFCIYGSPRYIHQFTPKFGNNDVGINYIGANVGVMYGNKIKYAVDAGYFGLMDNGYSAKLTTIGVGMKIMLGDFAIEESTNRSKKRKIQ